MYRPYFRQALLQEKLNGKVRCLTCERRCEVAEGGLGWCRTRQNEGGTLYTLIYGNVSSLSANPIEKKPLYHFYPGSVALTAGSWSCNFNCPWCQNWDISKSPPRPGRHFAPEDFVTEAICRGCQGTSISFNEPTLSLEWSLDVFKLARQRGLYNTYVTNGYMTSKALELLIEAGLDAMNVDIKGSAAAVKKHCGTDVEKVWRNCREAKKAGVHIEITFTAPPTPLHTLERAHDNPAFFDFMGDLNDKTVLDAGSGEGYNTRLLARSRARMTGVDISERM